MTIRVEGAQRVSKDSEEKVPELVLTRNRQSTIQIGQDVRHILQPDA